jgi:hypothetical protein
MDANFHPDPFARIMRISTDWQAAAPGEAWAEQSERIFRALNVQLPVLIHSLPLVATYKPSLGENLFPLP